MKRVSVSLLFVLLIISILAVPTKVRAEDCISDDQDQPCCNGIISTDPRLDPNGNPYSINQVRSDMVNKFNWMTSTFNVFHPGPIDGYVWQGGPLNIVNPFYSQAEYLSHINFYHHDYPYTSDKLSLWPEEGWELLHKNNGFQTNEIDYLETDDNRKGPYFILYNKYSGVMRLFAALPASLIGVSKVKTEIKFLNPYGTVSALLSEKTNISHPLDKKTKVYKIASSSGAPALGDFWTSDFYMAYDPCTCHYSSKLHFDFKTIEVADLDLTGRLIGTSVPLDGSGNAPMLNGRDFLTSVFADNYHGANAGILTYKNIDALAAKFKTPNLGFWEKAGIDALKAVFKGAGGALDGVMNTALGGPYNSLLISSGINGLLDLKGEQKLGLGIFASLSDRVNATLFPEHKIPNIGFIEAEMALTGTYVNEQFIHGVGIDFKLAVPGSKDTENPNITPWQEYPAYNEALGVFAILETPKAKRYRHYTDDPPILDPDDNLIFIQKVNYQLNELKYYFNPASEVDLEKTNILIAFMVDVHFVDCSENLFYNFKKLYNIPPLVRRYITAYYPLNCITKLTASIKSCDLVDDFDKGYIKILIEFVSKPNKYGKINKGLLQFTYPVQIIDSQESLINELPGTEFDLSIDTEHFFASQTFEAWNNIYIEGDLTADPGVNVVFRAGNEIKIKPDSKMSPNITLTSGLPDACEPVPPVSESYVKNFCTSQNYKANQLDFKVKDDLERKKAKEYKDFIEKSQNEFNIFPNPASTNMVLKYIISPKNTSFIKIYLHNFLGQTVIELISKENHPSGEFSIPVDVSGLSPGVYYCTMQSPLGVITKSFVIIK